ncbi:DUF1992 domain-containing protein [Bacillaceae bacterium SIJ1]|uniref:DnaJ family domain-containing protein n=1 Tax=Litoribacterium kuwaitense TaxID=1398745 RepID=UPI0013EA47F7|nr:DnaJ family domain-containing protein [Litoribacterium kuwaitense]NGP44014.1 DUF1992 domain-containing protein [Litoribacterium kuwaitense]
MLDDVVEERIRNAIKKGDFSNLPGKGRPLPLDDANGVPKELKSSYKVLKNAGMLPPEMELKKEILHMKDLLACCVDEDEKQMLQTKLSESEIRYQLLMAKHKNLSRPSVRFYQQRVMQKFRSFK